MASAFVKAYGTAKYDGEPVKKRMRFLLREVMVGALLILLEKNKEVFQLDENTVKEEQLNLRKGVVKSGPPRRERKRERTAKRLATRYVELLPKVREIRKFVEDEESSLSDTELRAAILRKFQDPWVSLITSGCALKNLLPIPDHDSEIETLSSKGWTARQLTVGIIVCEEKVRRPEFSLGPTTIYEKYIALGKQLIAEQK